MILLPDDLTAASGEWSLNAAAGTADQVLSSDDGNTSYMACNTSGAFMRLAFADPDDVTSANSGVAEGDIDTIDSVRFISSGRADSRSSDARVTIAYYKPAGNPDEIASYPPVSPSQYETVNGTARLYSKDSNPWTYSDLEVLELLCTQVYTVENHLSYLALEVTYTEVAATTDNATFFGANF